MLRPLRLLLITTYLHFTNFITITNSSAYATLKSPSVHPRIFHACYRQKCKLNSIISILDTNLALVTQRFLENIPISNKQQTLQMCAEHQQVTNHPYLACVEM